ncbi:MAG: MBL fold metallo-hydrolase [Candidatus Poribacteria bacterium]
MKYTALGGAGEVGASCHLLQVAGKNILIDSGLRPNRRGEESLPNFELLQALTRGKLDLFILSHAHIDHTGSLPLMHSLYPATPMVCTAPTQVISEILLRDTIKIMDIQKEEKGEFPLFTVEDVTNALAHLQPYTFDVWFEPIEGVKVYFHRSGHIVGAAAVLIETEEAKVVYSGDISVASQRTVAGMQAIDFFQPDLLILEGTYGDSVHPGRSAQEQTLAKSVAEVVEAGGTVLIPSFALGRAQEVILILKFSMLSQTIPTFPIYADGMVRWICDAFYDVRDPERGLLPYLPDKLQNFVRNSRQHVFWSRPGKNMPSVTKMQARERVTVLTKGPKVIVSSSGMLVGGPSAYYAKVLASDKKNAIFITGYQDEEAPGRRLLELKTGDTMKIDGEDVPMLCRVDKYNLSAHADQVQLCQQVSYMKPRSIILVHGDIGPLKTLREKLISKYLVFAPKNGESFDPMKTPEWMSDAKQEFIEADRERFIGNVTVTGEGVEVRFPPEMRDHPTWKRRFQDAEELEVTFDGARMRLTPAKKK